MLPSDQDLAQEVGGDAGQELDLVRVHCELEIPALRGLGPPAHKSFRITERGVPLWRIVYAFVIVILDHALLILRSEHGQYCGNLVDSPPGPLRIGIRVVPAIPPIPIRNRCLRVDGGAALRFRCRHQCVVMFLGGLIRIRAHDLLPRVIRVAVAPRSRARRIGANTAGGPNIRHLTGSVTPEVPLVRPKCLI